MNYLFVWQKLPLKSKKNCSHPSQQTLRLLLGAGIPYSPKQMRHSENIKGKRAALMTDFVLVLHFYQATKTFSLDYSCRTPHWNRKLLHNIGWHTWKIILFKVQIKTLASSQTVTYWGWSSGWCNTVKSFTRTVKVVWGSFPVDLFLAQPLRYKFFVSGNIFTKHSSVLGWVSDINYFWLYDTD